MTKAIQTSCHHRKVPFKANFKSQLLKEDFTKLKNSITDNVRNCVKIFYRYSYFKDNCHKRRITFYLMLIWTGALVDIFVITAQ